MGTWDAGPYDNDDASDWLEDLFEADPAEWSDIIAETLTAVVDWDDYLEYPEAAEAVAAAAVVASQQPGMAAYAPEMFADDEELDFPESLRDLAVRALDRVVGDESEWREMWDGNGDEAFDVVRELRAALAG
ncbi:hypothetical protein HDA40_005795 [Hamadaea flava]|uniref:DUF4259 domain-containing protein n=1 Tax=Hamadaea flava TaxID=1742688 RepID=A0ABV8LTQ4_9ACTN|nr:DUF4259 domain-containing protein [Hamadaea flava]MCP2327288.1 hypothetical protein [Hamadaea flava]